MFDPDHVFESGTEKQNGTVQFTTKNMLNSLNQNRFHNHDNCGICRYILDFLDLFFYAIN